MLDIFISVKQFLSRYVYMSELSTG